MVLFRNEVGKSDKYTYGIWRLTMNEMRKLIKLVEESTDIKYPDYYDEDELIHIDEVKEMLVHAYSEGLFKGKYGAEGHGHLSDDELDKEIVKADEIAKKWLDGPFSSLRM